jgi:transposase
LTGRPKQEREPLPPIWEAPDELWAMIEPILAEHDPPKRGPKRIDQRRARRGDLSDAEWLPVEPAPQGVFGR